jgi:hypothetical protein
MKVNPAISTSGTDTLQEDKNKTYFDAVVAIARVWDDGEFGPNREFGSCDCGYYGCETDGSILPLTGTLASAIGFAAPLNLSNESIAKEWSKSKHRLPIFSHELLLTNEQSKDLFRGNGYEGHNLVCQDSPKEVEFLGNGFPYPGRVYARAVIILWPKSNRESIESTECLVQRTHSPQQR